MIFTTSEFCVFINCVWLCADRVATRFGNFIGDEVESEAGSDAGVDAGDYVYDDAADDAQDDEELMEVDGTYFCGAAPPAAAWCS